MLTLAELAANIFTQASALKLSKDQAKAFEALQEVVEGSQRQIEHLQHKNDALQQENLSLQKQNQAHEKEKSEMKFALTKKHDGVLRNVASAARKEITGLERENAEKNLKHETAIARLAAELELRLENHENEKELLRENKDLSIESLQNKMKADAEKVDFARKLRIQKEVDEHKKTKLKSKHKLDNQKEISTKNQLISDQNQLKTDNSR
jgi:hypothetical protein